MVSHLSLLVDWVKQPELLIQSLGSRRHLFLFPFFLSSSLRIFYYFTSLSLIFSLGNKLLFMNPTIMCTVIVFSWCLRILNHPVSREGGFIAIPPSTDSLTLHCFSITPAELYIWVNCRSPGEWRWWWSLGMKDCRHLIGCLFLSFYGGAHHLALARGQLDTRKGFVFIYWRASCYPLEWTWLWRDSRRTLASSRSPSLCHLLGVTRAARTSPMSTSQWKRATHLMDVIMQIVKCVAPHKAIVTRIKVTLLTMWEKSLSRENNNNACTRERQTD